ncbi:unnamed protein product [Leptosia nina]|uniref:Kazal-like domain-containing protein n=1 Tax=Leptosia nina TaxID=320188 RepID=A0AAV1K6L2_9NEOP
MMPRPNFSFKNSPLCGTNFETFASLSRFQDAQKRNPNLQMLHNGKCKRLCQLYAPVCGSNEKTYHNICHLNYDRKNSGDLFSRYNGKCVKSKGKLKAKPKLFGYNYYEDVSYVLHSRKKKKMCFLSK